MKNGEQFENAVQLLRSAARKEGAPDRVEAVLRAAFHEQHKRPRGPRHTGRFAVAPWASAIAAGVVLGAVVWRLGAPAHVEAPPAVESKTPVTQERTVLDRPTVETSRPAQVASTVPRSNRTAGTKRAPVVDLRPTASIEVVSAMTAAQRPEEFLAIPYAPPMTVEDRGEVIRVRLPRQSVRSLGIPITGERLTERIPADLLVGEDGIPRGIRLVRTSEQP